MVQIKCLSNGLYSLKNSHIPFGMGFHPPPYGRIPFEQHLCYIGSSLIHLPKRASLYFSHIVPVQWPIRKELLSELKKTITDPLGHSLTEMSSHLKTGSAS